MPAFWLKPEDPVDPTWFRALETFAAEAAGDPRLPVVNPDHFMYAARIDREGFATLHAYRHIGTRRFLNVDDTGRPWRYTASDKVGAERYVLFDSVAEAIEAAELLRGNLLARHLRWGEGPASTVDDEADKLDGFDLELIDGLAGTDAAEEAAPRVAV